MKEHQFTNRDGNRVVLAMFCEQCQRHRTIYSLAMFNEWYDDHNGHVYTSRRMMSLDTPYQDPQPRQLSLL